MTVFFEDIVIGQTAEYARTVTEADVVLFAGVTGDTNPMHLNQEFAETTRFKGRIAHGALTVSFVSTVLGTQLPGPGTIFLALNARFKAPVHIGDTVTARVTVTAIDPERKRVSLATQCLVKGLPVLEGDALVMAPCRAEG
ncbi:MaoC family dehydratase [Parachitinimonas caeni]|uniref:MaoC family dehydratase n=1 Tax=Parachitinimonas caeni TaxID=3031301 RepID=A0ABT7E0K8_9NEIS|nr:MaoC family dehydratase [Parachitinimonas caeni]MDK2125855.1 MaoC family dehydratase [Parachitinimonas caeni]